MRFATLLFLLFAAPAIAGDIDAPITSGAVAVHVGSGAENPDAMPTVSISLRIVGAVDSVFCADVDAAGEVRGSTGALAAVSTAVLLEAVAWSAADCSGVESGVSIDRYRVVFAAPNRPVLIAVPPEV